MLDSVPGMAKAHNVLIELERTVSKFGTATVMIRRDAMAAVT